MIDFAKKMSKFAVVLWQVPIPLWNRVLGRG